jgi:hypothetical protein
MVYRRTKDLEAQVKLLQRQRADAARACDFAASQLRAFRALALELGHLIPDRERALRLQTLLDATAWAEDARDSTHATPLSVAEKVPGGC